MSLVSMQVIGRQESEVAVGKKGAEVTVGVPCTGVPGVPNRVDVGVRTEAPARWVAVLVGVSVVVAVPVGEVTTVKVGVAVEVVVAVVVKVALTVDVAAEEEFVLLLLPLPGPQAETTKHIPIVKNKETRCQLFMISPQ